ncbi:hypothetical protein ZIOFF_073785 [Zingiber officinale]|uniref:Uncharacterized protein n=1 Tax=Zingiber officinale TaxID=94328 RepID=A0A8J5C6F8_ZINOF|nr:hypothetical protein ZIOFF_073785 [Zingiber officinale]
MSGYLETKAFDPSIEENNEYCLTYNAVDDWAARAKAWAIAKSGTDIHHRNNPQIVPEGRRTEVHSQTYRDQYQATVGPPTDAQQSLLSQSTNQQPPHFTMKQQKQVDHAYLSASLASGSVYVENMHIHSTTGEEAAAQRKDHTSPGENVGPTPSIFEQEVPSSYSSIPGNRNTVSKIHLPVLSTQEGFVHPPPAFTDPNVAVDQSDLTHGGQSANYATNPSNVPLDFESRPLLDLESHSKINYVPIPSESMGMMDHDVITMPAHAWAPPAAPAVLPQVSISESWEFSQFYLGDDDKLYRTSDQIDNKSADSTKSTEDEDDDEVGAEAVRSAAVNQEIKRVLTEVLLKVTYDLFADIATKVLDEDDLPHECISSFPPLFFLMFHLLSMNEQMKSKDGRRSSCSYLSQYCPLVLPLIPFSCLSQETEV